MAVDFSAWDERLDDAIHLVGVRGEIDIFTAPEFKTLISGAIDREASVVVVDLSGATFIDSSSLGVLIGAHKRLKLREGSLTVVADHRPIVNTFKVTGLDGVFRLGRTRAEALGNGAEAVPA